MITLVLDTNVLVSALLSPFGAPARLLDVVLLGKVSLACDDRLLAEYREVLHRPRFAFDPTEVKALLAFLETCSLSVFPTPLAVTIPDPDDAMFLEVARAANALLVTGNLRHFPPDQRVGVTVLSPAEALVQVQESL